MYLARATALVCLAACSAAARGGAPSSAQVRTQPVAGRTFECLHGEGDLCWMRALADDPVDQQRATDLMKAVADRAGSESIAWHVNLALMVSYCSSDGVWALKLACEAGHGMACHHLYAPNRGCLAEATRKWPGAKHGAAAGPGSFASTTNALRLGGEAAPLGTVRAGTRVVVLGRRHGDYVILVLEERVWHGDAVDPRFVLEVPKEALTWTAPRRAPHVPGPLFVETYGRYVQDEPTPPADPDPDLAPDTISWFTSVCEPITILEERVVDGHLLQRVQQERAGVVLEGWVQHPMLRSWGPGRCISGVRRGHPTSPPTMATGGKVFVEYAATEAALAERMGRDVDLSMLAFDERRGPYCLTRRLHGGDFIGPWGEWLEAGQGKRVRSRSVLGVTREGLALVFVPTTEHSDGRVTRYRCEDRWDVVRVTDEAIELMPGAGRLPVLLYHPKDVVRWWFRREDCEQALAAHPNYSIEVLRQGASRTRLASVSVASPGC